MGKKTIQTPKNSLSPDMPLEVIKIELKTLKRQMEKGRKYLQSTVYKKLPQNLEIDLPQQDLSALRNIWMNWDDSRQKEFRHKFGPIDQLLFIEVDLDMVRAMLHFWDPEFRCFTFNEVDMAPTLEEYSSILEMDGKGFQGIYFKGARMDPKSQFAAIFGQEDEHLEVRFRNKDGCSFIPRIELETFITKHSEEPWSLNAFALALYGVIVFPRRSDDIEGIVVDFLGRLLKGANPIPVIVAETLRSLNQCRLQGKGRFVGCLQLLYVWIRTHFECIQSKFDRISTPVKNVLINFQNSKWPEKESKARWMERFSKLGRDQVVWLAPSMRKRDVLYKCGKYPWLPLLGLTGAVSFSPILFMRQFGTEQFTPEVPEMMSFDFDYGSRLSVQKTQEIVKAWRKQYWIIARWYTFIVSPEYERWVRNRGKPVVTPSPSIHVLVPQLSDIEKLEEEFEKERIMHKKDLEECKGELGCALLDVKERSHAVDRERNEHELTKAKLKESQDEVKDGKIRFLYMVDLKNILQEDVNERKEDNRILHLMYTESQEKIGEEKHHIRQLEETVKSLQAELVAAKDELAEHAKKKQKTN